MLAAVRAEVAVLSIMRGFWVLQAEARGEQGAPYGVRLVLARPLLRSPCPALLFCSLVLS